MILGMARPKPVTVQEEESLLVAVGEPNASVLKKKEIIVTEFALRKAGETTRWVIHNLVEEPEPILTGLLARGIFSEEDIDCVWVRHGARGSAWVDEGGNRSPT
jgi:hypothetical protein